jgi:hypothetical protein
LLEPDEVSALPESELVAVSDVALFLDFELDDFVLDDLSPVAAA